MGFYLAFKEIWRNKGRFFLFSLVIALITTLVLFIAALAEGLAQANKQYLEKLDAQLLVFQENVDLSTATSRIGRSKLNDIRRLEGIAAAGSIGFSTATLVFPDGRADVNISLIGVEAGQPGAPPVLAGSGLLLDRGNEAVIDANLLAKAGVRVGDRITVKSIQGVEEQFFELRAVGQAEGQQYLFLPSVFVPYRTWERIRPQPATSSNLVESTSNVVAVKLAPGVDPSAVTGRLQAEVEGVEVTDIRTAYESLPGYSVQQSTLTTMQVFTLLIGVLVIGGFFQIQILQKIPQIGVLKAIGSANSSVAAAVVLQIIMVTTFGVLLGALVSFGFASAMPATVPVVFNGLNVLAATGLLLLIGPLGGLVSVRLAVRVEPLIALGLSQ